MKNPEKGRGTTAMYGLCLALALVSMLGVTATANGMVHAMETNRQEDVDEAVNAAVKYYVTISEVQKKVEESKALAEEEPDETSGTEEAGSQGDADSNGEDGSGDGQASESEPSEQARPATGEPGLWD